MATAVMAMMAARQLYLCRNVSAGAEDVDRYIHCSADRCVDMEDMDHGMYAELGTPPP